MKYIKTYENLDEPQVGDYIIFEFTNSYGIFEIVEIRENKQTYLIKRLYLYVDELIDGKEKDNHLITYNIYNKRVIFRSSSLEECKDKVEIIANSKKYNL